MGGGILDIGNNVTISGRTTINANNLIKLGNDCMLSWDITLMDTDYHKIKDYDGNIINPSSPITIGNHVWIGCQVVILKGVSIHDNTIIAANNTITRSIKFGNCVVGGNGDKILKENVNWER